MSVDGGTWQLDPLSTLVHLRASVLGISTDCLVDVRSGTATVVDGGHSGAVTAEIDLTTFRSGLDRRDQHVKSAAFLDVAHHPIARFAGSWQSGIPGRVDGELWIRGVPTPVTLTVTLAATGGDEVTFSGVAVVSRRAAGVTRARFVLADRVDVTVDGVAHHHAGARPDGPYGDRRTRSSTTGDVDRARTDPS